MSQYVPVNLAYNSYDPAGGVNETLSPIIFLHGLSASKEMWNDVPQIVANKTKRKVYAIDARNHGDTEWNDVFNFDINADDVLHFMDTISAPKAVLVGHSMGGVTGIRAALKGPERIEMLFVEDMYVKKFSQETLLMLHSFLSLFRDAVRQLPVDCSEETIMQEIVKIISEKVPDMVNNVGDPEVIARLKVPMKRDKDGRFLIKANFDVILNALKNEDTIMTEPKGLYQGPAYFIYGTLSPFKVYEDESNIRKFFSKAEMVAVQNAEHSIHIQFPEKFIDIVVQKVLNH